MISFQEARSTILQHVSAVTTESVALTECIGRVIAEELNAPWDMPAWDNSAMDGYAVRHEDCAQPDSLLTVSGFLPAGARADGVQVAPGRAVRIMTGAPLPEGCTAIVPVEETDNGEEKVTIRSVVDKGQHIRFRGEDVSAGELFCRRGTVIRPPDVSMLASFGHALVPVFRRPVVAIVSTGDELIELGRSPASGEIINSNTLSLAAAVQEAGCTPRIIGIARDNRESHLHKLSEGLRADALVTTAGVSAGDCDLVRDVLQELGVRQIFWKVAIKPGKPTAFGMFGQIPVFSLPGNPVSSLITFEEFVRPALLRMSGHSQVIRPCLKATLQADVKNKESDRTSFLRVRLESADGRLLAWTAGKQQTGLLKTLVNADAIAVIPPGKGLLLQGEEIDVHLCGNQLGLE